jgi:hypothetical protein
MQERATQWSKPGSPLPGNNALTDVLSANPQNAGTVSQRQPSASAAIGDFNSGLAGLREEAGLRYRSKGPPRFCARPVEPPKGRFTEGQESHGERGNRNGNE